MEPVRFCKHYYRKEKVKFNSLGYSLLIHTIILVLMAFVYGVSYVPITKIALVLDFAPETSTQLSEAVPIDISSIRDAVDESLLSNNTETQEIEHQIESPQNFSIESPNIHNNVADIDLSANNKASQYLYSVVTEETGETIVRDNPEEVLGSLIGVIDDAISHNKKISGSNTTNNSGVEKRLKAAGAKTGDVQISLAWNTIDDIDLQVKFTPGNGLVEDISWINRVGNLSNGMLDIDMNASHVTVSRTPVENIFWAPGSSPIGFFTVYVHFFQTWTGQTKVPVVVRIKNGNDVEFFNVVAQLYSSPQPVKQFSYPKNRKTSF